MMYLNIQIPMKEESLAYRNKQKRKILTKTNKIKKIIESYKKMESFLIGK